MTTDQQKGNYTRALYVDIAALIELGPVLPPAPEVGARDDGVGLFYRGQVNCLFGDPESGKTLIAQTTASDELFRDGSVLIIDLDHNGAQATVSRFQAFGVSTDVLSDPARFRYSEPGDADDIAGLVADARLWEPTVVIIDSLGELLPVYGASSNSADDFTRVHSVAIKPFATIGASVILIDHLAKGSESRSYGATGTAAKKRAIGGTLLRVNVTESFSPGNGGKAEIVLSKDRHGGLRRVCPIGEREPLAARFHLIDRDGALNWRYYSPAPGEQPSRQGQSQPGDLEALSALTPPPASVRDVKERMKWGTDKAREVFKLWQETSERAA